MTMDDNLLEEIHMAVSQLCRSPAIDSAPITSNATLWRKLTDLEFHLEYEQADGPEKEATRKLLQDVRFATKDSLDSAEMYAQAAQRLLGKLNTKLRERDAQLTAEHEEMRKRFRVVNDGPRHDPEVRQKVWEMTNGHCAYCDVKLVRGLAHPLPPNSFEVEHVVPVSHGGPDTLANYVPACRACNASKNASHVLDFIRRIRRDGSTVRMPVVVE
jgi:5-methylcytosine-specific restriction endonuclease McrA